LAQVLRPLSNKFPAEKFPALLVGLGDPDDAAVYQINDTTAIIQTMDFFPPVVDDPYAFGAIAATNAMSDVYAMGGEVIVALNLAAWREELPLDILSEIFRGGADKVAEAGAAIAGGHTVTDNEPKYGLSVTGTVHPDRIIKKGAARVGDVLFLTKPLGTGLITTAGKNGVASPEHMQNAIQWMTRLNRGAMHAMQAVNVKCATDITGYALLGHAYEIAKASGVALRFSMDNLPAMDGALEYARKQQIPGGAGRNKLYLQDHIDFRYELDDDQYEILFDPQTSGGLLIAVPSENANTLARELKSRNVPYWVVGDFVEGKGIIMQ
jgi:selenide,water dikinase